MKYIVLIHANPEPWRHPVERHLPEYAHLSDDEREKYDAAFDRLLGELHGAGELVGGEAIGDPAASTVYTWEAGSPTRNEGPYAETKEHLAGYFVIDVKDEARAEAIGERFAAPGLTVVLRPLA